MTSLRYQATLVEPLDGAARVRALCVPPSARKLAVCGADNVVALFDESNAKRDKFATKASTGGNYRVTCMTFSPDSTRLAIGQSDKMLFVYRIGAEWNEEKKVITAKFAQSAAVTGVQWPTEGALIAGTLDGKVRLASVKGNKQSTMYNGGHAVCASCCAPDRRWLCFAHIDGSIVKVDVTEQQHRRVAVHTCAAYALAAGVNCILASGSDRRVVAYAFDGRALQQFDYSAAEPVGFTIAAANLSAQQVAFGGIDRLRLLTWNSRRGAWDEGGVKQVSNMYTVTTLCWRDDALIVGTLTGGVYHFDAAVRRGVINNRFNIATVGPSQVIIKSKEDPSLRCTLKSSTGDEIGDVKVLGKDNYVVAFTRTTLLVADMSTELCSEVPWTCSGQERFYFDIPSVCMVFSAGELSLIGYGRQEVLAAVRTEHMNPHLLSVRLQERGNGARRLAYLLDAKTVHVLDVDSGAGVAQVAHDARIDWLELSERGDKLLFRDRRLRLHLLDVRTEQKHLLVAQCMYAQWVPQSDVMVAQSGDTLCVWYDSDATERHTGIDIKGDVVDVVRDGGRTDVVVVEGGTRVAYTLDEAMIEFGTALDDGDLGRAVAFLEQEPHGAAPLWRQLANVAVEQRQMHVARRAYAALGESQKMYSLIHTRASGDFARVQFLEKVASAARKAAATGLDADQHYTVRARLAILARDFAAAEAIYLEQNAVDEAIEMYEKAHRYEAAIELAQARGHKSLPTLRATYDRHLRESGQQHEAAALKERDGDATAAIELYLQANAAMRAARALQERQELMSNTELVQSVCAALLRQEQYAKAGELLEQTHDYERALECYRKGGHYERAIELARHAFADRVVALEAEWAQHLVDDKQVHHTSCCSHFVNQNMCVAGGGGDQPLHRSRSSRERSRLCN